MAEYTLTIFSGYCIWNLRIFTCRKPNNNEAFKKYTKNSSAFFTAKAILKTSCQSWNNSFNE